MAQILFSLCCFIGLSRISAFASFSRQPGSRLSVDCFTPRYSLLWTRRLLAESSNDETNAETASAEALTEREQLQQELNAMMNPKDKKDRDPNAWIAGFDEDDFDESKLPLPLFSSVVIFVLTTIVTGYMFWVGIFGFPENEVIPRPF